MDSNRSPGGVEVYQVYSVNCQRLLLVCIIILIILQDLRYIALPVSAAFYKLKEAKGLQYI